MKIKIIAALILCSFALPIFAQKKLKKYEVEILRNEGKDTREFNSKLTFEAESLKVVSSRNSTVFAEMKYSEIRSAEYSYSKKPAVSRFTKLVASAIFPAVSYPLYFLKKKIHWLTIKTESDFAVLKLEGDNHKQIKAELAARNIKIENTGEETE